MSLDIKVLHSLDGLVPFQGDVFSRFIKQLTTDFSEADEMVETMVEEVSLTSFDAMSIDELLESTILVATQNIQNDIDFDKLATRLLLVKMYKESLDFEDYDSFEEMYKENFMRYIRQGVELGLLNEDLEKIFDLKSLAKQFNHENDEIFKYIGISTLYNRYSLRDRKQKLMETPQFTWMRVAMGLSLKEKDPTKYAKAFYKKLSNLEYIPGGSTNIGAGTTFSVLSNCYLLDTEDDTHAIFDNVKNVALISKATGGIGISISKLRASGSSVKSNNTMSTGPIPFIKVMDSALKSMSRAGKKYGAMCVYMENWHINFPEFLDLRQNAGDDYRRVRTADTAAYISDEFMKRVVENKKWYLFDPSETPELTELYGNEFSKKYQEYCDKADRGEMNMYKIIPAREQMQQILTSLQGTSHPWLTWKDAINLRALNNNTGTIHCSNLCTEICLPQDRNNIAVCNLAYINLATHVDADEPNTERKIDWNNLEETVRIIIRHLDNLVEVNELPLKEAKHSDENNRAIGMGMSGFAEILEYFGYPYDSEDAYNLIDRVTEFISYIAIDESANLAVERGSYRNFEGSLWSKGYVPYDTIEKLNRNRTGDAVWGMPKNERGPDLISSGLEGIRQKIDNGIQRASEEGKELYELFKQITEYVEGLQNENSKQSEESSQISRSAKNIAGEGVELSQDTTTRLDWDSLRKKVKRGMRNATVMAIAPNASTGLVLGTSPGIDPRFAQIFSRNTYSGKFLDINHNLVKNLKESGIWKKVKDQVLEKYGDISEIAEIPGHLKDVYKTSFQISPYAYLEVASRAQKWIDQSLSRNIYLETRDVNEMVDIYTEAWRRGLKTTYYLHVKPRHSSEQSTIKVNKGKNLNKKGFGSLTRAAQVSLDYTKEVKGFGFAEIGKEEKTEELAVAEVSKPSNKQIGFGTVKNKSGKAQPSSGESEKENSMASVQKPSFKPKIQDYSACPIDPAERAQCEACQ
jgi:ribonucleoside-diphosphate reductase alpha chain